MVDTLYSSNSINWVDPWYDGYIIDGPSSVAMVLRSLKIVNTDPIRDAWLWFGNSGINAWFFDREISGLHVPGGTTRIIKDLDLVLTAPAGDFYCMRQEAGQQHSNMVVSSAVAAIGTVGAGPGYTTASWTSVVGEVYVLTASVKGSNRNWSTITGHTGIAWFEVQHDEVTGSSNRIYQFVGIATTATTAAETVTFTGTNTSCIISIVKLQNTGATSTFSRLAVAPAGTTAYVPWQNSSLVGLNGRDMCGGRLVSAYMDTTNGSGWTPVGDLIKIHEVDLVADSQSLCVAYSKRPGNSGWIQKGTPTAPVATTNDRTALLASIHDVYSPLNMSVDGVQVT